MFINLLDIEKLNLVIQPKIRKWQGDARFNAFNKSNQWKDQDRRRGHRRRQSRQPPDLVTNEEVPPMLLEINDSKKDESKEKAVKTAEGAEEAAKNNSTPIGKRKGSEVISPSGLTPQNKTINTGMFIFNTQNQPTNLLATIIRPITVKLCSNNKENGYHLLAQPDRMNVPTTNLSDPK